MFFRNAVLYNRFSSSDSLLSLLQTVEMTIQKIGCEDVVGNTTKAKNEKIK